jgi:hypothetical protein
MCIKYQLLVTDNSWVEITANNELVQVVKDFDSLSKLSGVRFLTLCMEKIGWDEITYIVCLTGSPTEICQC